MPMHVSYVLLAEFDIDEGSVLKHQHPCPTGTNEHLLAEHMLPDGAHDRADDWTVFYLNQVPELTVDPKLLQQHHLEHPDAVSLAGTPRPDERPGELLYVLSLVRTKKVATVRRGALVKALAVATYNPYIQIFKPILLLALDDYFRDPSVACLARLYDSINAMDTTCCPRLSLDERLVLRTSERKDMFEEKFVDSDVARTPAPQYSPSDTREVLESSETSFRFDQRSASSDSIASKDANNFSDGASWKSRARADTIGSSEEVHLTAGEGYPVRFPPSRAGASFNSGRPRDTHCFDTTLFYADSVSPPVPIPTRIPLATFPGEVGDYSLIKLIQIFSTPAALVSTGALHAHLHTNGHLTHPILLLFNALVTHKRVIFLGHGQPAGEVANLVLAACALGSGCGAVFKGVPERAFPYTNLTNLDNLQTVPGFIAGVCNPAFAEHPDWWDVLCNIESGKIIVSKDIRPASFSARSLSSTMRSQTAVDFTGGFQDVDELGRITSPSANAQTKSDATDSIFMDEISTAIQSHFGEAAIRARFTDYAARFVRMASKYEEETTGSTSIGFPSANFAPATGTQASSLGSGAIYADDMTKAREMASNAGRIEGWRVTPSYALCQSAFQDQNNDSPIRSFDLVHQIARLRYGKNVPPAEALLIFKALSSKIRTDEEVIAFLALLPPHLGGLLPIGFGLFHPSETIRDATVDLFDTLNAHPTGNKFLQTLNAFHLSAYNRLSQDRLDTDAF